MSTAGARKEGEVAINDKFNSCWRHDSLMLLISGHQFSTRTFPRRVKYSFCYTPPPGRPLAHPLSRGGS
jgi:hypothetical protein